MAYTFADLSTDSNAIVNLRNGTDFPNFFQSCEIDHETDIREYKLYLKSVARRHPEYRHVREVIATVIEGDEDRHYVTNLGNGQDYISITSYPNLRSVLPRWMRGIDWKVS